MLRIIIVIFGLFTLLAAAVWAGVLVGRETSYTSESTEFCRRAGSQHNAWKREICLPVLEGKGVD